MAGTPTTGGTTTTPIRPNNEVRVKVYNGSGVQGVAQTLTDQLRAKGYNMQAPETADKERQGTVVQCVSGFEREGAVLAAVRRRQRCEGRGVPVRPARGRVRRRLHRRHRQRVARGAGGTVALPSALLPFAARPARAALFVDFDGSLSPIVLDPAAARPLPAARAALARLVPQLGIVAVVSGRPAAFLRDTLAIDGLDYVGTYGLERIVAGAVVLDERVRPFVDAVAQAADEAEAALPGLRVERKGEVAVTVHWRDQPERGAEAASWAAEAAPRLGLEAPMRGRMAVELRPPVPVDKGTTVADLAARHGRAPRSQVTTSATCPRSRPCARSSTRARSRTRSASA